MTRLFGFLAQIMLLLGLSCSTGSAQTFESVLSPGPVIRGHQKVEHECNACHVRFDRAGQDALCLGCHKDVAQDLRQRSGWHGKQKAQMCRNCHTDHRGRDATVVAFDRKQFDHRQSDFELRQRHAQLDCAKCHLPGKRWREASNECHVCHRADDVHKQGLGNKCGDCHNERKWKEVAFDHDKKTKFALQGKHVQASCDDCHKSGKYKDLPTTCISCHRKDDEHKGKFGDKCDSCHGQKAWKPSTFNHDTDTHYVLRGRHRSITCGDCHTGPLHRKLGRECVDCHRSDDKHQNTLGTDCGSCHGERGWKEPKGFDHEQSRFPLLGGHARVDCKACHKDALYRQTPRDCVGCHKADDKHKGTLGANCADCHIERDWKTLLGRFDHEKTKFPLRNAHAAPKVGCVACHRNAQSYRDAPRDCTGCHDRDDRHEGTLGKQCDSCHNDRQWRQAVFDHSRTRYPLVGRHQAAACTACHATPRYKGAATDCVSCHRQEDKHKGRFSADCQECHNTRSWGLWTFDHTRRGRYALEGGHARTTCEACHAKPAPKGRLAAETATDCLSCHRMRDVHDGAFGVRCDACHGTDQWKQIRRRGPIRMEPGTSAAPARGERG